MEKPRTTKFNPDQKARDFISYVTKVNAFKVPPNTYKPNDGNSFLSPGDSRRIRFAYSKEQRKSCITDVATKLAWVPSPNAYRPDRKHTSPRTLGNYTQTDLQAGLISDATAHGLAVPANNLKTPNLELTKRKAPSTDFKVTKTIRFKPLPKSDLSPTSYKPDNASRHVKPRALFYTQGKEKLKTYITRHTDAKTFVPSPSAYKIEAADRFVTLGARRSYK